MYNKNSAIKIYHPTGIEAKEKFQFRSKRDVIRANTYKLQSEYETMTPFGILGKYFSNSITALKGKDNKK